MVSRIDHSTGQSIARSTWLFTVVLALVAVCPVITSAQTGDAVRAELERTDQLIDRARDFLAEAGSERGQMVLQQAVRMQTKAWGFFDRGNLRMALRLTEQAREHLLNAFAGVRPSEDNLHSVERQLERTDEILSEARERIESAQDPMLLRRFEAALSMQNRAWELFRNQRLRPALKLTLEAREIAQRLGSHHGGAGTWGPPSGGEHLEQAINRLGEAIDRVAEQVEPGNQPALDHLERARRAYAAALAAFQNGQWPAAERYLRQTRDALDRTVAAVEKDLGSEDVSSLIADALHRWENLADPVRESEAQRLASWHEEAGNHLTAAESALAEGQLRKALVQTRSAMGLMDRIETELGL